MKREQVYDLVQGTTVMYKGKAYDFGYVGASGRAVIYEPGCRNMQDSIVIDSAQLSLPVPDVKIWVIMCNDYPRGATTVSEAHAHELVAEWTKKNRERIAKERGVPVESLKDTIEGGFWRVYSFQDSKDRR